MTKNKRSKHWIEGARKYVGGGLKKWQGKRMKLMKDNTCKTGEDQKCSLKRLMKTIHHEHNWP